MGNLRIGRRTQIWDAISYFGADLDSFWDTTDASKFTLSGSNVVTWAPTVGSRTATRASTGPVYSASARNGLPGVVFTGTTAERLTFSAAGLPTGMPDVTLIAVGFAADTTTSKTALAYGGASSNWLALRSIQVTGAISPAIVRTTGQYFIPSNAVSTAANYMKTWRNEDRIVMGEFTSMGITRQHVDGDSNLASYPYVSTTTVTTTSGRIGCLTTDTTPWDGVLQGLMIITRKLTQLEKDKLSVLLAQRYGLAANISILNPYFGTVPIPSSATVTSDLITGIGAGGGGPMEQKWFDGFTNLSRRQGTSRLSDTTGYNAPTSKGVWAFAGENDMAARGGFYTNGQDLFINAGYNWQSFDPTYPYLAQVDITANGLELFGSGDYPAVRAEAYKSIVPGGGHPYLSAHISTPQAAKIGPPGAHRFHFSIPGTDRAYSFPAVWALGDRYNGTIRIVGSISGTTLTVSSITFMPDGQALWPNTKLSTNTGGVLAFTQIVQQLTGTTGGVGTYEVDIAQTVASTNLDLFYPHQELDAMEIFSGGYTTTQSQQHTHILVDSVDVGRGMEFEMGPTHASIVGGTEHEVTQVFSPTDIYYMTKHTGSGEQVITSRQAWPTGSIPDKDRFHAILTQATGLSYEVYPGRFTGAISDGSGGAGNILTMTQLSSGRTVLQPGMTIALGGIAGAVQGVVQAYGTSGTTGTGGAGTYIIDGIARLVSSTTMQATPALYYTPKLIVRSVEFLGPASNTGGLYPPAGPTPAITWGGSFTGGSVPSATASGTTIGTLSGASTYAVFPKLSTFTGLSVTGSSLKTSGALSAGTYDFYIEGTDVSGNPGLAPVFTLTVT